MIYNSADSKNIKNAGNAMEITYYFKSKDPESKVVAEFGLKIPEWDLTFAKMKLVRTLNGNLFVAGPSYEGKDKDGQKIYRDYWHFGKDTSIRFKEKVLKTVQEYIEKNFGKQEVKKSEDIPYTEDLF